MRVFEILSLVKPDLKPEECKIHLATWNGEDEPLDVYLAGGFDEWQQWQTYKNFARPWVVSLISLPGTNRWLFPGLYRSKGCCWRPDKDLYYYNLEEDKSCAELNGRLVARFVRPGRQPYLNAEKWVDGLTLEAVYEERLTIGEFPGFKALHLTKGELELIVRQSLKSWRTALSSVAGVYLISDTLSGKLYVGSATGEGGIWQRWQAYAGNGHGDNVELRALLNEAGPSRANHFQYSVLEIADTHASPEDVLHREAHWKRVLMSQAHGLNGN
ncbi:MAG: GIY-YIG nuclease family protein [Phycisphaeraceae bacterium]